VLNLDFLLEEVIQRQKPIDWAGFEARQEAQPLRVVASGLHSEQAVVLGAREGHWSDLPGLAQCMRASMLLPGICGPPITLDSMQGAKEPLADAMLFEPIPYRAALAEGATHVLVLRTRPDGVNLVRKQAIIEKLISHRFFRRKQGLPRMAKHMEQQRHRILYAEDILRLNQGASATTDSEAAEAAEAGEAAPQLLAVALQDGPRGPEVSNLQTDSAELFYAVRCGFARGFELLRPKGCTESDAWEAACEAFPDSVLEEVLAKQGKEWAKPEAGDVGAGRSRAKERSGEGKERKGAEEPKPEATEPTAEPEA
jgi:predicted acylesterase/phospholipase RssA